MLRRLIYHVFLLQITVFFSATVAGKEHDVVVGGRRLLLVGREGARSWHDARHYCMTRGLDLVIINNESLNNRIFKELRDFFPNPTNDWFQWWIGITDEAKENDWRDVCYRKLNYERWDPTDDGEGAEPNNYYGREHCAHLYARNGNYWNDQPCEIHMPFICAENHKCDSRESRKTVTIPSRLLLVNNQRTWPEAREYCQNQGLDLAVFRNKIDYVSTVENIRKCFPHSHNWFMGITLDQKSKKYVDICTNKVTYLPWEQESSGLVDDDRGCVYLQDDGRSQFPGHNYRTASCNKLASFICREHQEGCSPLVIPTTTTVEIPTRKTVFPTKRLVTLIPTAVPKILGNSNKSSTLTISFATAKPPSISPTATKSTPTTYTAKPPTSFRTVVTKPSTKVPISTEPSTSLPTTATPTTALPITAEPTSMSSSTAIPATSSTLTTKPTTYKSPITSKPPTVSSKTTVQKTTPKTPTTMTLSTTAIQTPTPTLLTETTLQSIVTTLCTNSVSRCSAREAGACYDEYGDCDRLGPRVCSGLATWAAEHCRKYCGLCQECEDLKSCGQYGDTICSAAPLSPWVDVYCRKFCNRC